MSGWGERRRRVAAVVACLALALTGLALVPGGAAALDSDLKHSYAFRVEASNGYSITALANSERADGRGELVLFVTHGNGSGAYYVAPATLSATRIDADLGALGRVALDVAPSGRRANLRSPCEDEPGVRRYEPWAFSGSFEFHGEEGYTDALSTAPRDYAAFYLWLVCVDAGRGGGWPRLPGARLSMRAGSGAERLSFQIAKNRPGGRARMEASVFEKRGAIRVQRFIDAGAGPDAFDYDPMLRTATIAPPAPFSGHGTFHRDAAPANRWRGNLSVDFPGRSDVELTGAGARIRLIHARFERG